MVVAVAVATVACAALAPAANASLSVPAARPLAHGQRIGTRSRPRSRLRGGGRRRRQRHARRRAGQRVPPRDTGTGSRSTAAIPARRRSSPRAQRRSGAASRLQPLGARAAGPEVAVANDGFSVGQLERALHPVQPAERVGAVQLEHGGVRRRRSGGQASTPVPAQTRGLGVVFLNVRTGRPPRSSTTTGTSCSAQASAPRLGGTSFAGVLFRDAGRHPRRGHPRGGEIFGFDGSNVTPGSTGRHLVAGDDIVLAEPAPARPAVDATAGVPISPVLDTFTESDSSAYVARDDRLGRRNPERAARSSRGRAGRFVVTGTMPTPQAGSYSAEVTVEDSAARSRPGHADRGRSRARARRAWRALPRRSR